MEISPVCIECKHYKKNGQCSAFNEIPSLIWSEGDEHLKPLPGQKNDIVFEPIKKNE